VKNLIHGDHSQHTINDNQTFSIQYKNNSMLTRKHLSCTIYKIHWQRLFHWKNVHLYTTAQLRTYLV